MTSYLRFFLLFGLFGELVRDRFPAKSCFWFLFEQALMLKSSVAALFLLSASSLNVGDGSGSILVDSLSSFQSSSLSCRRRRSTSAEGIRRNAIIPDDGLFLQQRLPYSSSSWCRVNAHRASFAAVDGKKEENGSIIINDQILESNNNVDNDFDLDIGNHPINVDELRRRLRPYKTNVDIENAMTNFGRQGQIRAVLELYNSLWKLDTL